MKRTILSPVYALCGASLVLTLGTGCASQDKLRGYETEIVTLREQKTQLRKENQNLKRRVGEYEIKLADANMKLLETPSLPELDSVGVTYGARDGNLVITLPNDITFGSGKATLTRFPSTRCAARPSS